MKAIILAGGYGTRLHPISLGIPKPMATLVDQPLLEHIIQLLKSNGLTDICMTLRYLPKVVTDYFGDGSSWGVRLHTHIENNPLGTAGGIKDCRDFLDGEDFLVISGDAACDLDLKACVDFHYQKCADVTIVLNQNNKPLEYGLVLTDGDGRVEQFIEKPSRDRVYTDHVNTGIYVISNRILDEIPDNTSFDFARDLFPKLLTQKRNLFGCLSKGYWCDVGSCLSYLRANFDALSGNLTAAIKAPEEKDKIWSLSKLNARASYKPPCYIGEGVTIGDGAVIGPFSVIGSGSSVGQDAVVRASIISGAMIGDRCRLSGSIVCRGAKIGSDTQLMEGSVVGETVVLGSGCLVSESVRIWPDKQIPPGTKLKSSLISGMPRTGPMFEVRGIISGELGLEVTPELCLSMGSVVGAARVGITHSGGEYARILAECFGCGVSSSGGQVYYLDSATAATAAHSSALYRFTLTLFAAQKGKKVVLWFFNEKGLPISRDTERKLESASPWEALRTDFENTGALTTITGTVIAHAASAASCASLPLHPLKKRLKAAVSGRGASARILRSALEALGISLTEPGPDVATLEISPDGFSLIVKDEQEQIWEHGKLLTALALMEFEHGEGTVVLPYFAPAAAEVLASKLGGKVLRLGRDGVSAEEALTLHPHSKDGIFLALRLISSLGWYENRFSQLMARIPSFFTAKRDLKLKYDRGRLMRELKSYALEASAELVSGLKFNIGEAQAYIIPRNDNVLSITAEGYSEDIAEELCAKLEEKVKEIVQKGKNDSFFSRI